MKPPTDELDDILTKCLRLRGCYPLMNRTHAQFFDYLLTHKREQLIPLAKDFLERCVMLYTIKQHDDALQQLARGASTAHRVYTCPNCGRVGTITLITGEMPKCGLCGKDVTYIYEAEQ